MTQQGEAVIFCDDEFWPAFAAFYGQSYGGLCLFVLFPLGITPIVKVKLKRNDLTSPATTRFLCEDRNLKRQSLLDTPLGKQVEMQEYFTSIPNLMVNSTAQSRLVDQHLPLQSWVLTRIPARYRSPSARRPCPRPATAAGRSDAECWSMP